MVARDVLSRLEVSWEVSIVGGCWKSLELAFDGVRESWAG